MIGIWEPFYIMVVVICGCELEPYCVMTGEQALFFRVLAQVVAVNGYGA